MKALTFDQPYAQLVALGEKMFDVRETNTDYRGPVAIHATLTKSEYNRSLSLGRFYRESLAKGHAQYPELPFGAIIATAELVAVHVTKTKIFEVSRQEREYSDKPQKGRYMYEFANAKLLPAPIPAHGHGGVWEWDEEPDPDRTSPSARPPAPISPGTWAPDTDREPTTEKP